MPAHSVVSSRPATGFGRRWRRLALPAALAIALLVGACQSQPGSAAFVGSTRISEDHVDQLVDGSVQAAGRELRQSDMITFRRQITDLLVKDALADQGARRLGVPVTPDQVKRALDQTAASAGGTQAYLKAQARNGITEAELLLQQRLTLNVQNIGKKLAGNVHITQAELRAIYQQAGGQAGTGLTFQQALPKLRQAAVQQESGKQVTGYLTKLAKQVGVRVNPRFGEFDAKQLQVVATSPNYFVSTS